MPDKWYVVINPRAGGGRALRKWPRIRKLLDKYQIPFVQCITPDIGRAQEQINEALNLGLTRFVSVGGDGSHHTLINALKPDEQTQRLTLAIIPAGTGNDWARTHHITRRSAKAVQHIVAGHTTGHALGLAELDHAPGDPRRFVNVLGCGLDGQVVSNLAQSGTPANGTLSYLYHGVKALISYQAPELRVSTDSRTESGRFVTAHAGIGKYSGGGMLFTPHAQPDGQELAVTCIRKASKISLLSNIYRVYTGTIAGYRPAVTFSAQDVRFMCDSDVLPVEADGEYLGNGNFSVRIIQNAFDLVIPEP